MLTFPKRSKEQCSSTASVHAKNLQCAQITGAASVLGSFNMFMCLEIMEGGNKIKTSKTGVSNMRDTADNYYITDILLLTATSRYKASNNRLIIQSSDMGYQERTLFVSLFCAGRRVCVYTLTSLSGLSCSSVVLLWWGLRCEEEGDL